VCVCINFPYLLKPVSHISFRPYLEAIFSCFDTMDSDYEVLFALCLLYALGNNSGK